MNKNLLKKHLFNVLLFLLSFGLFNADMQGSWFLRKVRTGPATAQLTESQQAFSDATLSPLQQAVEKKDGKQTSAISFELTKCQQAFFDATSSPLQQAVQKRAGKQANTIPFQFPSFDENSRSLDKNVVTLPNGQKFSEFEEEFRKRYPDISIPEIKLHDKKGKSSYYKPLANTIFISKEKLSEPSLGWTMLHETGHSNDPSINEALQILGKAIQTALPVSFILEAWQSKNRPPKGIIPLAVWGLCYQIRSEFLKNEYFADTFANEHATLSDLAAGCDYWRTASESTKTFQRTIGEDIDKCIAFVKKLDETNFQLNEKDPIVVALCGLYYRWRLQVSQNEYRANKFAHEHAILPDLTAECDRCRTESDCWEAEQRKIQEEIDKGIESIKKLDEEKFQTGEKDSIAKKKLLVKRLSAGLSIIRNPLIRLPILVEKMGDPTHPLTSERFEMASQALKERFGVDCEKS